MDVKRKIRRSRSLSDISKVGIPKFETQENTYKEKELKDQKSKKCYGNEGKQASTETKEIYGKKTTSVATKSSKLTEVSNDLIRTHQNRATQAPSKKSHKKSYRRKRRATLADLTCIDVLKPIPEMEEDESGSSGLVDAQEESTIRRHSYGDEPRGLNLGSLEKYKAKHFRSGIDEDKKNIRNETEKLSEFTKHDAIRVPDCEISRMRSCHARRNEEERVDTDKESEIEKQRFHDISRENDKDDDREALEVKNAVLNYELTYDLDENERLRRLQETSEKNRQRSYANERLPNTTETKCDRSEPSPISEELHGSTIITRKRRFSTSHLHLTSFLEDLPSIAGGSKKSNFSSSSNDSDCTEHILKFMIRRRSSLQSTPALNFIKEEDKVMGTKQDKEIEKIVTENSSSSEYQHCGTSLLANPRMSSNTMTPQIFQGRINSSLFEELKRNKLNHLSINENLRDSPVYIDKKIEFSDNKNQNLSQASLSNKSSQFESKKLISTLKQKVNASLRRRNSIASAKPWTGILERSLRSSCSLEKNQNEEEDELKYEKSEKKTASDSSNYLSKSKRVCFLGSKGQKNKNLGVRSTVIVGQQVAPDEELQMNKTVEQRDDPTTWHNNKSTSSKQDSRQITPKDAKMRPLKTVEQIYPNIKRKPSSIPGTGKSKTRTQPSAKSSLILEKDLQVMKSLPVSKTNDKLQKSLKTFTRSTSEKRSLLTKANKEITNPSSSKNNTKVGRPESPKLQNKKKVPVEKSSSNSTPRSLSYFRPPSPSAVVKKTQSIKNETSALKGVKIKPTGDNTSTTKTTPKSALKTDSKSQNSKRPSSPLTRKRNTKVTSEMVTRQPASSSTLLISEKVEKHLNYLDIKSVDTGKSKKVSMTDNKEQNPKQQESCVHTLESSVSDLDEAQTSPSNEEIGMSLTKEEKVTSNPPVNEKNNAIECDKNKERNYENLINNVESKIVPDKKEQPQEWKNSVNVMRRPLSPFTITIPYSPSKNEKTHEHEKHPNYSKTKQEGGSSLRESDKKLNGLPSNNSNQTDPACNKTSSQENAKHNFELEVELDSFSSFLREFEKSSSSPHNGICSPELNSSEQKASNNTEASKITSSEQVPTEKRFAALSERYAAIMSKFGISNKTKPNEITSGSKDYKVGLWPTEDNVINAADHATVFDGVHHKGDSLQTASDKQISLKSPSLTGGKNRTTPFISLVSLFESPKSVATSTSLSADVDAAKKPSYPATSSDAFQFAKNLQVPIFTIPHENGSEFKDESQRNSVEKTRFINDNEKSFVKDAEFKGEPQINVEMNEGKIVPQGFTPLGEQNSHVPMERQKITFVQEMVQASLASKVGCKILSTEVEPVPLAEKTVGVASFDLNPREANYNIKVPRTTVIACLIDRKLCPRRKHSIVPTLASRKSKVFDINSEARIQGIPLTIEHFNRYRNYIEKMNLKSAVRTEALSIHDILNGLNTSLVEVELIALCKECTKTLRTLDALGSLPSYLSPHTVIVNPSGTIKFRHLSSDVTIDDLFLAPEHSKKFPSEKTCVFSLAATIWLAADWKLTEDKKPVLSCQFQELLVSMTTDSSSERATFDSILQICESLQTDNEMSSRERCQVLLWECQATKDLDRKNVDEKATEGSKKTKAQHAILMGSVSVAANTKGFLKQTHPTTEKNNNKNTKPSDVIAKSLETKPILKDVITRKLPQRKNSLDQEITYKDKQSNSKASSPADSMFTNYPNPADASMIFSPITPVSGNTNTSTRPNSQGSQLQTSAPTFVPIAIPVPSAGPPPMWYMTSSGMVPFGHMAHHPGYFMPVNHGSGSSVVSESEISGIDEMAPKQLECTSRPSTPMSELSEGSPESKQTRAVTPSKSKIPIPIREHHKRNPRPTSPHHSKGETKSSLSKEPSKRIMEYRRSSTSSTSSPPVRLKSGSVELKQEEVRRPRPRLSLGSLVSSPRSGENTPRPSSPRSGRDLKIERFRPSSPSFSGHFGSRPSSPVGSRSSSPVSALISRFEDLSSKEQTSEHSQSVSNLISRFGSSSFLSEDRLAKRQFKTNMNQPKERSPGRSEPFRPESTADHHSNEVRAIETNEALSKSWPTKATQGQSNYDETTFYSSDDSLPLSLESSPQSRNVHSKEPAVQNRLIKQSYDDTNLGQTRNRLGSSLENLYGISDEDDNRQASKHNSLVRNRERIWTSVENVHKECNEKQMKSYNIRKSSSAENLSNHSKDYKDLYIKSAGQRMPSISSQRIKSSSDKKLFRESSYTREQKLSFFKKKSEDNTGNDRFENRAILRDALDNEQSTDLVKDSFSKPVGYYKELDTNRKESKPDEHFRGAHLMKPERDYQEEYMKELTSPSARSGFEIPVTIAVMDSEIERIGTSPFSTALFSPSSVKNSAFFQHPVKLEKDSTPLSPPAPLSPSVRDCRPTSYFSGLSFSDLEMKPERDTTHSNEEDRLTNKCPSDTQYHTRNGSYHVDSRAVDSLPHDNETKINFSNSERRDLDRKGYCSSREFIGNSNDYLKRFEKRLTKTNSSENIKQKEENHLKLGYNESRTKHNETNAFSVLSMNTLSSRNETLAKLFHDSQSVSQTNFEDLACQTRGTSPSLGITDHESSSTLLKTNDKLTISDRNLGVSGGKERDVPKNAQPPSRPSRAHGGTKSGTSTTVPPNPQSSQTVITLTSKPSSLSTTSGKTQSKLSTSKPSSVPTTPTSSSSRFYHYERRQSSPHVTSQSEVHLHSRLNDDKKEPSGSTEHQDASNSSSSKFKERMGKRSLKPHIPSSANSPNMKNSACPSPEALEQNTFDFSDKALKKKDIFIGFERKANISSEPTTMDHANIEKMAKSKSSNHSDSLTMSKKTTDDDLNVGSFGPASSRSGNVRQLVLRSPTSPTLSSSSSSSSSSPSPSQRLPLNKYMFYNPQNETGLERQLSPTEQINSSGQKGFVITDTSRQSKAKNKIEDKSDRTATASSSNQMKVEENKPRTNDKISSILAEETEGKKPESRNINVNKKSRMNAKGSHSSDDEQEDSYDITNINLKNEDMEKGGQEIRDTTERSIYSVHRSSVTLEDCDRSSSDKEKKDYAVDQREVSEERRKSVDLRQTYNSALESSLSPRTAVENPCLSPSTFTPSRPNSALSKRPPSPIKLDSKELLGHFVKKVLNSATVKSAGNSPSASFADVNFEQRRESSGSRERKTSSKNKPTDRRESLRCKQPISLERSEARDKKVSQERKSQQGTGAPERVDSTERETSYERKQQCDVKERNDTKERKASYERKQHGDQERNDNKEKKASYERKQHGGQERNESREKKISYEGKQQHGDQGRNETREKKISHERKQHAAQESNKTRERRLSYEKEKQYEEKNAEPFKHKSEEQPIMAMNEERLQESQGSLDTSSENDVLNKLVEMIHDEFAFDGYLDDGIEDVNMGEYVTSLSGMNEDMFKESVRDQYSDLYWDDDLLQDMYILVNRKLTSRRPTLRFSESTGSDVSRPDSSLSTESNSDTPHLDVSSVSRTSSERSFCETRDYVMSSLGEPTQFLPFKMICPEISRDIIEELGPLFEDYQKEMKIKLAPSISELMEKLGAKIMEIGQQLTLERRAKKKNIASFKKVADIDHKKDVKDLASKLLQEIEESDKKIIYLKHIQRRLRNIYAERFGLDHSLLYSFVNSYSTTSVSLEPNRQNNQLSFSPLWDQRSKHSPEAHGESTRGPVLQYGTTQGLLSYMFARHSMSQAYVRFFLYTFRYCATPKEMFEFIRDKCRASLRADTGSDGKTYNHQLQIRYRALDLLAEWVDCCFQFDFRTNPDLLESLFVFLNEELIPVDKTDRGKMLVELITEKQRKDEQEQFEETTDTLAVLQTDDNQSSIIEKESPKKFPTKRKKSPVQCFKRGSPQASSMYKPALRLKAMSVIDHSSRTIAEQLTLIQQDTFARAHSIHFLNSRTLGIGVGRLSPTKETNQLDSMLGFSAGRRRSVATDTLNVENTNSRTSEESNLFVCSPVTDGCLEDLLTHAQDVSMWVAVEICSAPSVKNQLVLIQKYVSIAKYCADMRNFATTVEVVDALEMFVIRQLPVWKQVSSKVTQTLEELKAIKILLKTDSTWLLRDNSYREKPTLPCALLFLMHIQQLELGGFTLANGMYKWTKMRSIARFVDQIRLFKQMRYAFESNDSLTDRLRMRIQECREENLHALAAENAANFHLSSSQSSRKFQEAFRKMKATFGNG